ncbi:MAG: sigma 54-interacting transcriptional regulator [Polyangiaceae bacterium]|nr:sigma 54-interacting transcriptional regulator [Polyangiaceae bacterium]
MMKATETVPLGRHAGHVVVLTYVLSYADLLADVSASIHMEIDGLPLVLGRAEDCEATSLQARHGQSDAKWLLTDRWMSHRHATIRYADGACVITDEGSKNGVFVNGSRVAAQCLADGDLIEVGHALLCYRLLQRDAAAPLFDGVPNRTRLGPTASRSPEVVALARNLSRIALANHSVLILGEPGSGKDIAARAIHDWSQRCAGPYVHVDCGEIPEAALQSTLLGHEKGAFAGATKPRIGLIESASGGTLFLDDVGSIAPSAQATILRVLKKGLVTPLGSVASRRVNVRWIAAMSVDPSSDHAASERTLPKQLAEYVAHLPPLRRRREDLGTLARHFLREARIRAASISAPAARKLFASGTAANLRGLQQVIVTAARLAAPGPIEVEHLALVQGASWKEASDLARASAPCAAPADSRGQGDRRAAAPKRTRSAPSPERVRVVRRKVRVLYLAANPRATDELGLSREIRRIRERIRASEHRDALSFICRLAVRPDDVQQALLEVRPHIVHFSGHGTRDEHLLLEDDRGGAAQVDKDTLAELLGILKDDIQVVVLNACHTVPHAEALTRIVDGAIGVDDAITDEASIEFSASFYRAVGFGRSLRDAFELGRIALRAKQISGAQMLKLRLKSGVDPDRLIFVSPS